MRKRWTAAGMLEAEQQFRRVVGYSELPSSSRDRAPRRPAWSGRRYRFESH